MCVCVCMLSNADSSGVHNGLLNHKWPHVQYVATCCIWAIPQWPLTLLMSSLSPWMASNKRCRYLSSAYKQQTAWPTSTYISAQWLKHPNEKLTFPCNFHSAQSPVVFLQSHLYWVSVIDNIHCRLVHHLTLQTEPAPCTRAQRQAVVLEQCTVLRQQCTLC